MKLLFFFLPALLIALPRPVSGQDEPKKPNIIYILADDLGYGDLSCYGQQRFQTPNIDRLAAEGIRFTQHYAGTTVCAPSRSALLTGRHTGHTPIRGNKEVQPEGQWPLPAQALTVPEMLKTAGYVTGGFGKWGLGPVGSEGDPVKQGFDEFFGYNCQRLAHHYYPHHLWHNDQKVWVKGNSGTATDVYAPELIHQKALQFIDRNHDTTFFLYYPTVIPHAELFAPEAYLARFRGKFPPEKSYEGVDSGDKFRLGPYGSQPEAHAAFAAMISVLDDQVGEILAKLEELGLDENTLIVFTSDNGPHLEGGADPDYFDSNGPFRGYKRDLYEGGIRVPLIVRWPHTIAAGTTTGHVSAFWDVLPTFCQLAGVPAPDEVDGISFVPTLLGKGKQPQHNYLYWEFHEQGGRVALRKGDWKLVRYEVNEETPGPFQLYNLTDDPAEENDLAAKHPEKVREMKKLMEEARTDSEVFQFRADPFR